MRFKKIYIEITNVCNLSCDFCVSHNRENRFMTEDEFKNVLLKIKPYTDHIYMHVKGEPLIHPKFDDFVKLAFNNGFKINLTTNATLLEEHLDITKYLRQINISFHATNDLKIIKTCKKINDCIINFRIWNVSENKEALDLIKKEFNINSFPNDFQNFTLKKNVFLSIQDKFSWPDITSSSTSNGFCYGLNNQIGILVDGTVVPCCLDNNGDITLGNILNENLENIINSNRSQKIIEGFKNRIAVEELCKKCTYKNRF